MDNYNDFRNFTYQFSSNSDLQNFSVVRVTFIYLGRNVVKDLYFPISTNINVNNYMDFVNFVLRNEFSSGALSNYSLQFVQQQIRNTYSIYDNQGNDVTMAFLQGSLIAHNPNQIQEVQEAETSAPFTETKSTKTTTTVTTVFSSAGNAVARGFYAAKSGVTRFFSNVTEFVQDHKKPCLIAAICLLIIGLTIAIVVPVTVSYYNAEFEVTWENYDGSLLDSAKYKRGSDPVFQKDELLVKPSSERAKYSFKEWEPKISKVDSNITYKATYESTTRMYTVKWYKDENLYSQDLIWQKDYEYDSEGQYEGATPTKPGYQFVQWKEKKTDGTSQFVALKFIVKSDRNFYATWKQD